jgi:hypothetical protein
LGKRGNNGKSSSSDARDPDAHHVYAIMLCDKRKRRFKAKVGDEEGEEKKKRKKRRRREKKKKEKKKEGKEKKKVMTLLAQQAS